MRSDIDIARAAELRPITEIAKGLGLQESEIEPYGAHKAKIRLDAIQSRKDVSQGKYVVVTAITPTPLGEGKTTTTVGRVTVA